MKITNVEAFYLRLPVIEQRTDSSQDALLIKITTDAGITGWVKWMAARMSPKPLSKHPIRTPWSPD